MTESVTPTDAPGAEKIQFPAPPPNMNRSTLIAYAIMRGPVSKKNYGPLYISMDPQQTSAPGSTDFSSQSHPRPTRDISAAQSSSQSSGQSVTRKLRHKPRGLDKSTAEYQAALKRRSRDSQRVTYGNTHLPTALKPEETYQKARIAKDSIIYPGFEQYKPDHFHDDHAQAEYGYLKVNGIWVDPDDERTLSMAFAAKDPGNNAFQESLDQPSRDETCKPKRDSIHIVRDPSSGPHQMSPSEEAQEYAEFTKAVDCESDSNSARDHEGDPRTYRITPRTFAKWAEGATKGSGYVYKPFPSEVLPEPQLGHASHREKHAPKVKHIVVPQCDIFDCTVLSPAYSVDSNPAMLRSPSGEVDMINIPDNFSYMNPLEAIAHKRARFFDAGISRVQVPSEKETFCDDEMREALAVPGNVKSGARKFKTIVRVNNALKKDMNAIDKELDHQDDLYDVIASDVRSLSHEVNWFAYPHSTAGAHNVKVTMQQNKTSVKGAKPPTAEAQRRARRYECVQEVVKVLQANEHLPLRRRRHIQFAAEHTESLIHLRESMNAQKEYCIEGIGKLRQLGGGLILERNRLAPFGAGGLCSELQLAHDGEALL